jgi:ABC-type antimicrobial peptide transport system permease subunit
LTIAGGIAGIGLAAVASRFADALVYGIRTFDIATYLAALSILIAVALLACLIPGRRATAIDPVRALRE